MFGITSIVDKTAPNVDRFYCKLCDIQCTGVESFNNHTSGSRHCKKFLTKQNDLGFDEFDKQFVDVPFNRQCGSVPPPMPQERYALQVYRSGLANKYSCKACGTSTFQMLKWFEHVYSYDHGEKIQSIQNTLSRALFLNQFGALPGPNPKLFIHKDGKFVPLNNEEKLRNGTAEDSLEYPFNLNLDSLMKPHSSNGSSENNHRSPGAFASNHRAPHHEQRLPPGGNVGNQSRDRRRHLPPPDSDSDEDVDLVDDKFDSRKRMKMVRIRESLSRHHAYSPPSLRQYQSDSGQYVARHGNEPQQHIHRSSRFPSARGSDDLVEDSTFVRPPDRARSNRDGEMRQHTSPGHSNTPTSSSSGNFSFQGVFAGADTSDGVLQQTLREFLANVLKRQPPRSDKMPTDDELFRSLSKTEQRHLLNIHALTSEDSAWRCYAAVNFIRSLDPQLLTTIARLVDKHSSPAADVTRSTHASRSTR